jgi:hypothetical protein
MSETGMDFRVVTAVGGKRVGRIVGSQGDYHIVKRPFGRGALSLNKRQAVVEPEESENAVCLRAAAKAGALQRLTLRPKAPADSPDRRRAVNAARRTGA